MVHDTVTTMHPFHARTLACQPCQNPAAKAANMRIGLYSQLGVAQEEGKGGGDSLGCLQESFRCTGRGHIALGTILPAPHTTFLQA